MPIGRFGEAEEIAENPEEEQEELALIYQSKGLPEDRAKEMAAHMMADKKILVVQKNLSFLLRFHQSLSWTKYLSVSFTTFLANLYGVKANKNGKKA